MDRKRNILIREMVLLLDKAQKLRGSIEDTYETAYKALQRINITLGVTEPLGNAIPIENGLEISYRSVMGVELPIITLETTSKSELSYGLAQTNSYFDYAYKCFNKVKELTVILAEVENCIYRLAIAIKKTQKRANALKNILIPKFEEQEKYITNSLEEKEREEFFREKVIKRQKLKKAKKIS